MWLNKIKMNLFLWYTAKQNKDESDIDEMKLKYTCKHHCSAVYYKKIFIFILFSHIIVQQFTIRKDSSLFCLAVYHKKRFIFILFSHIIVQQFTIRKGTMMWLNKIKMNLFLW
jgi:hypothetical protein